MTAIGPDDRRRLLLLARSSIRRAVTGDGSLDRLLEDEPSPPLRDSRGVFVSLKRVLPGDRAELRGCVGVVASARPLYRNVIDMAAKAALDDPRFAPVDSDELTSLRIEVSVLTRLQPLKNIEDLVIGRDGVQLEKGSATSVFLPQVGRDNGWDPRRLLERLSEKAGLAGDAWTSAKLSVFQVEAFDDR